MEQILCFNYVIGRCDHCKPNMDPETHPNNRECPDFVSVLLVEKYYVPAIIVLVRSIAGRIRPDSVVS